jgi:hypothetical protein
MPMKAEVLQDMRHDFPARVDEFRWTAIDPQNDIVRQI